MISASSDMIAFLNANTRAIKRHLVTITLADTTVIRWTDNESDLVVGGNTYTAGGTGTVPLIEVGKVTSVAGTEIGDCELNLLCGEDAQLNGVRLPLAVTNNALDGAKVKIERVYGVDELDLTLGTLWLFEGVVAEAKPTSTRVELSLVDGREELQVQLPRTPIQPPCTAMLFDSQCSLVKASWTVTGTVSSGATAVTIPTSRTDATGYFKNGMITFTSGQNSGLDRGVRAYSTTGGTFTLDEPLPSAPAAGDTFSVYPGCDKSMTTCNSTFSNLTHFRGFPYLPGSQETTTVHGGFIWSNPVPTLGWGYNPPQIAIPVRDRVNQNPRYGQDQDKILPIVYGRAKVPASCVYLYQYTDEIRGTMSDIVEAICEGPIDSASSVWWSSGEAARSTWTVYGQPGALALGTRPTQTAWSRAHGKDSTAWTNYPGVACLRLEFMSLDALGGDALSVEVNGFQTGTGDATTGDANPADIVSDLIPYDAAKPYNAQFSWTVVTDTGTDGNAASSFRRYVTQAALWLSPVLDSKRPAIDWLGEILSSCNASCRWSGGQLVIVPLGDQAVGTYTPDTSIQYALTEDDYLVDGAEDAVEVERRGREEVANVCPVTFRQRTVANGNITAAYQEKTVEDPEPVDLARNGLKRASAVSMPMICRQDVAMAISRLKAQRSAKARNTYRFRLGWRFRRLEPLDYVTISDDRFGFTGRVVRVTKVEESDDVLTVEAEDAPIGHATAALNTTQSSEAALPILAPSDNLERIGERRAFTRFTAGTLSGSFLDACFDPKSGRLIGVANNTAWWSADSGKTWTAAGTPPTGYMRGVCATSTRIVCAGDSAAWAYSTDGGATWTSGSLPSGDYQDVATDGTGFVAVGSGGAAATSTNGTTWSDVSVFPANGTVRVTWTGFSYIALLTGASYSKDQFARSTDSGATWSTAADLPPTTSPSGHAQKLLAGVGSGGTAAVMALGTGTGSRSLDDGVTWTSMSSLPTAAGCFTGRQFVVIRDLNPIDTDDNSILVSDTGATWTGTDPAGTAKVPYTYSKMVFDGRRLCILGANLSSYSDAVPI